jgi:putative peptidoglycan lipid II flippase
LGLVFVLTMPASVGLMILGPSIVGAIYEGVKFQPYDTQQTSIALAYYAIGLAGYAAVKVLAPAFYALNDSRTPMWTSLGSIAINAAMAWLLVRHFSLGHAGLAMSTSAVALFSFLVLFFAMRTRIGGVYGRRMRSTVLKVAAGSVAMGAAIWLSTKGIHMVAANRTFASLLDLAVSIPLGLAVVYAVCRALKVEELEMAVKAFAGPLSRRLGGAGNGRAAE